ncbi:UNVERIFIED_CONTAM: hypothetical protein Sradi_2552200 [Sesamum radiatum]|uniref:Uncharacterized protein n=1 Tax=Sesamum radiatum TaxID=300843 RepID=A0AAW2SLC2_SESRA
MGMIVGNEQEKSQLATEISELLARAGFVQNFTTLVGTSHRLSTGTLCSERAAFDLERKTISCSECNTVPRTNSELPRHTNVKIQTPYQEPLRFNQIHRRIKELRTKLKEEATIIEKCLKTNAITSRRESPNINATRAKETPVFNPSNYQYKGYPHNRTINHKKLEDLRAGFMIGNRCMQNTAKTSCPIFQCRPERMPFMSRYASARNQ